MDDIYNWGYYLDEGYGNSGDKSQDASQVFKTFFAAVADRIVRHYNPKTVLDAGCAVGFLVAALRERGVEAYGFDVSEDAIAHADEAVRPYLQVSSLLNDAPLQNCPERFDLVTNIEVLEHLYEDEVEAALAKLCTYSDRILFSSSPSDVNERTHFNVRLPEYWAKLFANQGFYRSTTSLVPEMLPDAIFFAKRGTLSSERLVEDYERYVRLLKHERPEALPQYLVHAIFDYGQGFTDTGSLRKEQQEPELDWIFALPKGATQVQIALPAGQRSFVQHLRVQVAGKEIPVQKANGDPFQDPLPLLEPGDCIRLSLEDTPAEAQLHLKGIVRVLRNDGLGAQAIELQIAKEHALRLDFASLEEELRTELATLRQSHWETEEALLVEKDELRVLRDNHAQLHHQYHETLHSLQQYQHLYAGVAHSSIWRLSKPLRAVVGGLKRLIRSVCLHLPGLRRLYPYLAACRMFGKEAVRFNLKHYGTLEPSKCPFTPSMAQALEQERIQFSPSLKFSVVCPLYNTPAGYLREMIQSVVGQTYSNWELCLADGSDTAHAYVEQIVREFQKKDSRVRYQRLEKNEGIAGNTNAAIDMAEGDFVALLDHDDVLVINALYEMRVAIDKEKADFVYTDEYTFHEDEIDSVIVKHFKPDYAPDNLRANNYICHFTAFKRSLLEEAGGGFRSDYDGSQDYDIILRLTEKAQHVAHVHKLLYCWRSHGGSVAANISAKPYCITSAKKAIGAHLERQGLKGSVDVAPDLETIYKVDYEIEGQPKISIIIPNKDEAATLSACLHSVLEKSTYPNYEIIIAENGSTDQKTFALYKKLQKDERISVVTWEGEFNFSAVNNYAAGFAKGDYLLFLNNDTEVINKDWLEEMLMFAQRSDVGAVGAKLYFPDDTIQHAGVVLGMARAAGHSQYGQKREVLGYMGTLKYSRNVTALTGACLMLSRAIFEEVGGFNEKFVVAMNDVDLCLRVRKAGYLNVFTPFAELYHHESKSRGVDLSSDKFQRLEEEVARLNSLWGAEILQGDPYYNRNFDLNTLDIVVKPYVC